MWWGERINGRFCRRRQLTEQFSSIGLPISLRVKASPRPTAYVAVLVPVDLGRFHRAENDGKEVSNDCDPSPAPHCPVAANQQQHSSTSGDFALASPSAPLQFACNGAAATCALSTQTMVTYARWRSDGACACSTTAHRRRGRG